MRRLIAGVALCGLLAVLSAATRGQPPDKLRPRQGSLKVNDDAPDFTVKDIEGKETTRLADLRGKPVVLVFGSCT
jgi:cytochrome oxidase Cu insertion factor (SCO1/SenC/PrrC family)